MDHDQDKMADLSAQITDLSLNDSCDEFVTLDETGSTLHDDVESTENQSQHDIDKVPDVSHITVTGPIRDPVFYKVTSQTEVIVVSDSERNEANCKTQQVKLTFSSIGGLDKELGEITELVNMHQDISQGHRLRSCGEWIMPYSNVRFSVFLSSYHTIYVGAWRKGP